MSVVSLDVHRRARECVFDRARLATGRKHLSVCHYGTLAGLETELERPLTANECEAVVAHLDELIDSLRRAKP